MTIIKKVDYINIERLKIVNEGNKPTFNNGIREEVLNLTLTSMSSDGHITYNVSVIVKSSIK